MAKSKNKNGNRNKQNNNNNVNQKAPCRWDPSCNRIDCEFSHPRRNTSKDNRIQKHRNDQANSRNCNHTAALHRALNDLQEAASKTNKCIYDCTTALNEILFDPMDWEPTWKYNPSAAARLNNTWAPQPNNYPQTMEIDYQDGIENWGKRNRQNGRQEKNKWNNNANNNCDIQNKQNNQNNQGPQNQKNDQHIQNQNQRNHNQNPIQQNNTTQVLKKQTPCHYDPNCNRSHCQYTHPKRDKQNMKNANGNRNQNHNQNNNSMRDKNNLNSNQNANRNNNKKNNNRNQNTIQNSNHPNNNGLGFSPKNHRKLPPKLQYINA
ncbi:MAG: hypothetical protein M1834_006069 [Cirrosporium novae-zelandiae]|nr:MAG: hypothetical protein M1834_006069 [Cirrosporium novae-zelandiae]